MTTAAVPIPVVSPVSGPTLLADLNINLGGWRLQQADDSTVLNTTATQPWFPTAGGQLVAVAATTTYQFLGQLILTTGAGSHTTGMSFNVGAGTATFNSVDYLAEIWSSAANTITTAVSQITINVATNIVLNAASTAVQTVIRASGIIRVNAAGTLVPQFTFSGAPGTPNNTKRNSFFSIWPLNPISPLSTDDRTGSPYAWT